MTAEEIANLLKEALDGIELLDNEEREDLIRWVGPMQPWDVGPIRQRSAHRHPQQMCARLPRGGPHVAQSPAYCSVGLQPEKNRAQRRKVAT